MAIISVARELQEQQTQGELTNCSQNEAPWDDGSQSDLINVH